MVKGEENAKICWYCQKIAHCYPAIRPQNKCSCFVPMGKEISHKRIAALLSITLSILDKQMRKFGTDYIITQLNERGHIIRYQVINKYTRFYEMNTGA